MSRSSSVFKRLEQFTGNKYPIFIKNILEHFGYNDESTLLLLSQESIKQIEIEITAQKDLIKDTVYKKKDGVFQFLIGHKELISSIPDTLKERSAEKTRQKKVKERINKGKRTKCGNFS